MAAAELTQVVNVSLQDFYSAVVDYDSYPKFVTGMKATRVVEEGPGAKLVHFDLEMMKRFEYSVKMKESFDESTESAEISWTLHDGGLFKLNNGSWKLRAMGEDKTEVTYRLEVEFSFGVPGFILKSLVKKAIPTNINEFTKWAQQRKA